MNPILLVGGAAYQQAINIQNKSAFDASFQEPNLRPSHEGYLAEMGYWIYEFIIFPISDYFGPWAPPV